MLRKIDTNSLTQNININKQLSDALEKMNSTIVLSSNSHDMKLSNMEKAIGEIDGYLSCCAPVNHHVEASLVPVEMMCDTQDNLPYAHSHTATDIPAMVSQHQTWAARAGSHVPVMSGVRSSHQGISQSRNIAMDSITADSENDSGQVFTEVLSRRTKKRKTNSVISLDSQLLNSQVKSKTVVNHNKVIGKLQSDQNCKIKASGIIIDELVYCVSNVSEEYNCNDLCDFLADNNVKVVSCFDSKTKFTGTKAFRVCIASKFKELFLSPAVWPEDVIIREWFFKGKQTTNG